ncbi:hypothetical protein [Pseudidiomarina sediminum]|uniref:hypothetical protein n=1 Tax=Pseudidiomarina sediminum TaxID=431675 RepID=UPI001C944911|nr:hypothetical protein [Pseudidiomarina sediminum]MBY6063697.1 hypothetical protein [Pseudidiomarina sediminum]
MMMKFWLAWRKYLAVVTTATLVTLIVWLLQYYLIAQQFERSLAPSLQSYLQKATDTSFTKEQLNADIQARIAVDASPLHLTTLLGGQSDCVVTTPTNTTFGVSCSTQWPALLLIWCSVFIVLLAALKLLPKSLTGTSLKWYQLACQTYSKPRAKQIATSNNTLEFSPANHQLSIHGMPITLSKTPYFYYLWYAQRRLAASVPGGWHLNPSQLQADTRSAQELIALMRCFKGHTKAINDLESNDLRAKTLDRNRNKIKEELTAVLGEELAADYLFDAERDPRTNRFKYRLKVAPENISIKNI